MAATFTAKTLPSNAVSATSSRVRFMRAPMNALTLNDERPRSGRIAFKRDAHRPEPLFRSGKRRRRQIG